MATAAASITYQAGANTEPPERCVNQVRIALPMDAVTMPRLKPEISD